MTVTAICGNTSMYGSHRLLKTVRCMASGVRAAYCLLAAANSFKISFDLATASSSPCLDATLPWKTTGRTL